MNKINNNHSQSVKQLANFFIFHEQQQQSINAELYSLSISVSVILLLRTMSVLYFLIVINSNHSLFVKPVTMNNGGSCERLTALLNTTLAANCPEKRI